MHSDSDLGVGLCGETSSPQWSQKAASSWLGDVGGCGHRSEPEAGGLAPASCPGDHALFDGRFKKECELCPWAVLGVPVT